MNCSFADFPKGFGHDARLKSLKFSNDCLTIELEGSVVKSFAIPEIIRMWLTEFTEGTVIFNIRSLDQETIESELQQNLDAWVQRNAWCPDMKYASKILGKGGSCILIESSYGLEGVVLAQGPQTSIQVTLSDRD